MSYQWKTGQIIMIGTQKRRPRFITKLSETNLINATYKIISTTVQKRVIFEAKGIIVQYYCEFTQGTCCKHHQANYGKST